MFGNRRQASESRTPFFGLTFGPRNRWCAGGDRKSVCNQHGHYILPIDIRNIPPKVPPITNVSAFLDVMAIAACNVLPLRLAALERSKDRPAFHSHMLQWQLVTPTYK